MQAVLKNFSLMTLSFCLLAPALGDEAPSDQLSLDDAWTVNLYLENDLFGETDQNYTNGIRLSWVSPNLTSYDNDPDVPKWINTINNRFDKLLGFKETPTRNLVISLGQSIYTPETIEARELLVDERPYAGYLYLGFAYHGRTENRLDSVEVNLGIVGPSSLGEQAQDNIHNIRGLDKFQGWDNQLSDEPTLQLVYENKLRLFKHHLPTGLEQDFISHAGAALGSVAIYANAGGEYRFGWDLPEDFGTSAVRPGGDNSAPGKGDIRLRHVDKFIYGLHGFISVDGRMVGRDIFIDGNTWENSHRLDREYFVADIAVGFSFLVRNWKLSYAQVFRTKEFKGQPRHHEYGSLTLSYTW
ncbi:MAG: lipid A deacylase LpxR family protein [Porticoccaceae bacterium]